MNCWHVYFSSQHLFFMVLVESQTSSQYPISVVSDSDYVHDVSYNYYGTKMAICTSSQSIHIWEKVGDDEWKETAKIENAHSGPIWRLDWAHPEFGNVLVSCSEDRTVSVWSCVRENVWKKRATLTDSPHAITDVQFGPRNFGLKFAACSSDGMVRVYEASDPLNLGAWEVEDFAAGDKGGACSALSWCTGSDGERIGVVGESGRLKIFEKRNRWVLIAEREATDNCAPLKDCAWAPNLCRDHDWIATCGDSETVTVWELRENRTDKTVSLVSLYTIDCKTSPIWRCAWSITGDVLALAPESGEVQLWRLAGLGGNQSGWERLE